MATQNYFAMDPAISRSVSNLTRALIGSPSDDAASARARYYDAQTVGQNTANERDAQLAEAGAALASSPQFQSVIAQSMGLNTMQPSFVGPPSADTVRTGTDLAANLARTFLGEYGNAQQMANAADAYGGARSSRLAESMILGGSPDQAQRGALMMAPRGGQYQNPDFAGQQLAAEQATEQREDDMRFGPGGLGDRDTKAREATNLEVGKGKNQVAKEVGMDANERRERWEKHKAEAKAKVDRAKNKADDATARYKIDNEPVEINVTPGKMIILDPSTAERIGVKPIIDPDSKFNGLHVLDGGKKPGDVVVKVGREDVFMDEATAKALNIPKNEDDQYVLPGAGFKTTSSGSGFTVASNDDTGLRNTFNAAADEADMPASDIPGGVQDLLVNQATSASVMGDKKNMAKGNAYIKSQLRKGFVEFEIPDTNILPRRMGGKNDKFKVPVFMIEFIKENLKKRESNLSAMRADAVARQDVINKFISAGYTDVQAAIIADGMQ